MVLRWRHLVWSCIGAAAWAGCAHAPPPRALVEAREAYQQASSGPAAQERPQDVADAWQALLEAERAYDKDAASPRTRSLAYVALRKAQLAEVRASAQVAQRERALAEQSLREVREAERQRAQAELQAAQQQLAEARRQRAVAEERARQGATQEEVARLQAEAERQRQEAERLQADAQRRSEERARQAEVQRQQQEEQQRRAQVEAEAQRLAQQQQEEQQRRAEAEAQAQQLSQQLEQERLARQDAERRAAEQVEAERQARAAAEQRATLALNALQGVKVREEARGMVVTLSGSVLFASGKAELLPASRNRLEEVARALEKAESPIVVEGHTDARGTEEFNEELSRQRAEAVRDFLVSRGVPADRIEARGLGEYRPVANNTSAEGRANNRRVEIILPRDVATSGQRTGGTGGAGNVPDNESGSPPAPQNEMPPDPATQPDDPLGQPGSGDGR